MEAVGIIEEHGIVLQIRDIGTEKGHGDHVSGILDEDTGVAMVRVIIVGSWAQDDISMPFADEASNGSAILQGGQQFAVMDIQDLAGDPEDLVGMFGFRFTASGQGASGFAPVADVAVGDGDQFDMVAFGGPHGPDASGLDLAIIGVSAEANDTQFAVIRRRIGGDQFKGKQGGEQKENR
jgi:hypothetical protein